MIIAFPPCTFLTVTGNRWFNIKRYGERAIERLKDREKAIQFFLAIASANCERIAIENPVGIMSSIFRKPDQIIQPWQFLDGAEKTTCLWLKGLNQIIPKTTKKPVIERYKWTDKNGKKKSQPLWYAQTLFEIKDNSERAKIRSKTFPGIGRAMAEQWASGIINTKEAYQLRLENYVENWIME